MRDKKVVHSDWENLMEWIFQLTPNGVLTAHTEWLPGVRLRHFSTTCAVYTEGCGGWWLSGCCSSVAEHWLHKLGVLSLIPSSCWPFTSLHFHLKNIVSCHLIFFHTLFRVYFNCCSWTNCWIDYFCSPFLGYYFICTYYDLVFYFFWLVCVPLYWCLI